MGFVPQPNLQIFLQLKVTSWESLANKLNAASSQTSIIQNQPQSNQGLADTNIINGEDHFNNIEKLTVFLEPDVAKMFPNSQAVNEALRFLIRVTSKNR
ncbi:hypothetical protein [Nostoc sp.]|uniref:hypothetical protein n=1 Tax=Nostoc sp. TaxID=1180 RepID=UPI002FF4C144